MFGLGCFYKRRTHVKQGKRLTRVLCITKHSFASPPHKQLLQSGGAGGGAAGEGGGRREGAEQEGETRGPARGDPAGAGEPLPAAARHALSGRADGDVSPEFGALVDRRRIGRR